jgi:hypothetical protein
MAIGRITVEGHAIVSEDGMIADARGEMPGGLRNDADWRLFQAALDRAGLVVLGRLGHKRHPNRGRLRLVLTREVEALERDSSDARAWFWNPAGLPVETVLARLDIEEGVLAITGGTGAFDYFLQFYDRFVLAEVPGLEIPGGTPCFSSGPPKAVLSRAGFQAAETRVIDEAAGVTLTVWTPRRA